MIFFWWSEMISLCAQWHGAQLNYAAQYKCMPRRYLGRNAFITAWQAPEGAILGRRSRLVNNVLRTPPGTRAHESDTPMGVEH